VKLPVDLSPDPIAPDLEDRDARLDGLAAHGMTSPLAESAAPPDLAGVDAALASARAALVVPCGGSPGLPAFVAVAGGYERCPGCRDCEDA
jgi:hypothetical protein